MSTPTPDPDIIEYKFSDGKLIWCVILAGVHIAVSLIGIAYGSVVDKNYRWKMVLPSLISLIVCIVILILAALTNDTMLEIPKGT